MKLSMWHLLQDLEDFQPEYSITDGAPRLTGPYLLSQWDEGAGPEQYACLRLPGPEAFAPSKKRGGHTLSILNGPDSITLRDIPDISVIVNRLMALFAGFDAWENRLRQAARREDLQEIVDIATEKLDNPILVFDLQGNVLAMSAAFLDETGNDLWNTCRQTRRVPVGYSAQAMTLEDGRAAAWTREPAVYILADGARSIGNYVGVDGEAAAGFALHESGNPIRPGDVHLVRLVQSALADALHPQREDSAQRTLIHSLQDVLAGVRYEDSFYDLMRLPTEGPWRLALIDKPRRQWADALYRQLLPPRLRSLLPQCVPLEFDGRIVALAPEDDADALIGIVNGGADEPLFITCLSLPFRDLRQLHVRYRQTLFALEHCGDAPGVYRGEDFALAYLSSLPFNGQQALAHPLLAQLRAHDAQKGSALYDTLFQYLIHERSLQKGAAALHVHKNTYAYRLERIRELGQIDLDDPATRLYLMISYVMEGAVVHGERA